jgi:S1-C subfamily serine protease
MRNLIVFGLFFVVLHPTRGQEGVSVETIEDAKRVIVPVICGFLDDNKQFQISFVAGTGFFVDFYGRFVTDAHVLDNWEEAMKTRHACYPAIYIPDQGWDWKEFHSSFSFQVFEFLPCEKDVRVDLAICQPKENPFRSKRILRSNIAVALFDTEMWPEGTAVAFSGFPLESKNPITSKGFVGGFTTIGSKIAEGITGFDYFVDKAAWPGASGSPVYLANGKVIAIMRSAGENANSGISWARSATTIVDFLSKHPYGERQPQANKPARPN